MKLGKKLIALLTVMLMVFGNLPLVALADAAHPFYYDGGLANRGLVTNSSGKQETTALITIKKDSSSVTFSAYCCDLSHTLTNDHFSADTLSDGHIRAILYADLSSIASSLGLQNVTSAEKVEAAQAAIWHFSDSFTLGSSNSDNVKALYNALIALPSKGAVSTPDAATASAELVSFDSIDGSGLVAMTFRYQCSDSSVTLTPSVGTNGTLGTPQLKSGWYYVSVSGINPSASFTFSVSGKQTLSYDACLLTPDLSTCQKLVGLPHSEQVSVSASVPLAFGSARVRKVFTGTADNDQGFSVTIAGTGSLAGKVSRTVTVNSNSTNDNWVTVSGLPSGTYAVTETLSDTQQQVYQNISIVNSATGNNTILIAGPGCEPAGNDVTVTNKRAGSIDLFKKVDTTTSAGSAKFHFTVTGPNSYSQSVDLGAGEDHIFGGLPYGAYTITEDATDNFRLTSFSGGSGTQSGSSYTVTLGDSNRTVTVTANNQMLGKLVINKTDSHTGGPVSGVTFHIAGPGFTGDKTTDASGSITIDHLTPGASYTVTETSAPADYNMDSSSHPAQTIPAGGTATFNFSDVPVGIVKVIKQDTANSGTKISGVTFQISKSQTDFTGANLVATLTTGSDGTATSGKIETGSYWIKETNAPSGYVNDNATPVQITVVKSTGVVDANTFTFKDRQYVGSLLIKKASALDSSAVAGAQFQVSRNSTFTDLVANLPNGGKTDASGQLQVDGLTPGPYWVREVAAAPGYTYDASVVRNVTVTFAQSVTASFTDTPTGTVKVVKTDAYNGAALAGAVFGVYSDQACTQLVDTLAATDAGGLATSDPLPFAQGTVYYVKEISAPAKYIADPSVKSVSFTAAGQVVSVSFADQRNFGDLKVKKVLEGGDGDTTSFSFKITGPSYPNGYTFQLANNEETPFYGLTFGTYVITELSVPAAYKLESISGGSGTWDGTSYTVTLSGSNQGFTVTASNRKLGSVDVKKLLLDGVTGDTTKFDFTISGPGLAAPQSFSLASGEDRLFPNLEYGQYTITEHTAPDGYAFASFSGGGGSGTGHSWTVTVGATNLSVAVTCSNHKLGKLQVVKTKAGAQPPVYLAGAVFGIYSNAACTQLVEKMQATGVDGKALSGWLTPGIYYVKELSAPSGYGIDSATPVTAQVNPGEVVLLPTFTDTQLLGSAKFSKVVDNDSSDAATFTLRVTGDNGYSAAVTVGQKLAPVTLSNLPFGHYTVTEDAKDGYQSVSLSNSTFTVDATNYGGAAIQVLATNHKLFGSATFSKVVDNVTDDPATFTLQVVSDTGYSKAVTVGEKLSPVTLTDLPFGHYTVTENGASGYSNVSIQNSAFTIDATNYTAPAIQVVATNHKLFGSAVFKKNVNNITDDPTTFTLQISGDNGYTNSVTVGETLTPVTLTGLPFGHYTVTEVAKTGYQTVSITNGTFTIDASSYQTAVTVTAVNHKQLGSAVFSKVVDNIQGDPASFTLHVTSPNGYSKDVSVSESSDAVTLSDLPLGTYTVTEAAKDGYQTVGITHSTFTIDSTNYSGAAVQVVATNHKLLGSAVFSKVIDNDSSDAATFTLNVTGDNGYSATVTVGQKLSPVTLNNLPFGHYTVAETAKDGYQTVSVSNSTFTIDASDYSGPAIQVAATNHRLFGSAVFSKIVDNVTDDPATFTLHVSGDNGYAKDVTVGETLAPVTLSNLPFGHYTVTESPADGYQTVNIANSAFTVDATSYQATVAVAATNHKLLAKIKVVKTDAASPSTYLSGAEFKISTSDTAFDTHVVDTITTNENGVATSKALPLGTYWVKETQAPFGYAAGNAAPVKVQVGDTDTVYTQNFNDNKLYGSAVFSKVIDNNDQDPATFTLHVTADNGYSHDVTVGQTIAPVTLANLPCGHYTVTEAARDGYQTVKIDNGSFTIDATNYQTAVAVKAHNCEELGSAVFSKVVDNVANDPATFTLSVSGDNGYAKTVTVGEQLASVTLANLPFGHYTVTETAKDGYQTVGIAHSTFTIDASDYNGPAIQVTATNHKLLGSAEFYKIIDNASNDGTAFTLHVTADNGYARDVTVGEIFAPVFLTDLPFGHYTVTEAAHDGYQTVKIDNATFTVDATDYSGAAIAVAATNHKLFGAVLFSKVVDNVANDPATFTLHVAGDNGYNHDVTVGETLAAVSLTDLPFGHYTVTEADKTGYQTVGITHSTFTVDASSVTAPAIAVVATNHKLLGSASFTKLVSNVENDTTTFTLRVTGDNSYSNTVTVGEMLAPAQLTDLPFGHYTVTEDSKDGYKLDSITPASFDVTAGSYTSVQAVQVVNEKLFGSVEFIKAINNESGDSTAFTLHVASDTGYAKDVTVGETFAPVLLTDLPFGHYTVTEAAHDGYTTVGIQNGTFTIDAASLTAPTIQVVATNHQLQGKIRVLKADAAKPSTLLKGAEFKISTSSADFDAHVADTITTGDDGTATSKFLPLGVYYVKETKAPTGYAMDSSAAVPVTLTEDGVALSMTFSDSRLYGKATFTKQVDNVENDGTTFTLHISGDNGYTNTVTIGEMIAPAALNDLPFGHYTVTEDQKDGYKLDSITPAGFDVDASNYASVTGVLVVNSKELGSAVFSKLVSNVENDATTFTLHITGSNGYTGSVTVGEMIAPASLTNLPLGHYTVTEDSTDGYKLDSITPASFDVTAANYTAVQAVEVVNEKLLGSAVFSKAVANDTDDDATFTLSVSGDNGYAKTVTVGQKLAPVTLSNLPFGHYTVTESPHDGYTTVGILNGFFTIDASDYSGAPVQVVATNHKLLGLIRAVKKDTKDSALYLGGAVFEISTQGGDAFDNNVVDTMTTDAATGVATSDPLVPGTYYVKEIKAPSGYVIDDSTVHEAVVADGETYSLPTFTDTKYEGALKIKKVSAYDHTTPVEGVQFQVATDETFAHLVTLPNNGMTDANGELLVQHLTPDQTYWVREISAAPGYSIDPLDVRHVTVVFNATSNVLYENSPVGQVKLTKVDSANPGRKLAGAVFGVYSDSACTALVQQLSATDANGLAASGWLEFGQTTVYYVKEITAPQGYLLNPSVQQAVFTAPGQVVSLTFSDVKNTGSLIIKKVNALNTAQTLAGAQFNLYSDEALTHQVGATVTTGADGLARFDDLTPGLYYVKEIKAPTDYDVFPDAVPVTVTAGVTSPDPIVITDEYHPPKPYHTATVNWNVLAIGLLALLSGGLVVFFTRKRKKGEVK